MIDSDLLRQLGWSNDLIAEVSRVAEPMRKTSDKMEIGPSITTLRFSGGSTIFADQHINDSSQAIKVITTR